MISTRGRYALRVMIDLAEQGRETYTPLKEVAERQRISKKYIEAIMASLSKAGLVDAVHGKGGGYRLNKPAEEYTVGEILRVTEGDLAPVACLEHGAAPCEYAGECKTLPVWDKLNLMINGYLDGITLAELA
ncbi:MAG: RrF2 family transcriptional regulator [Firmicutes bacterium]|nr:RrF2 family transcriptional regulator [Bacillota bacterium]MBQ1417981.1 RrF2 family transcriptional regulator [Bacillota bacterium]MBQ2228655.1 RrF2 family transcriptional regulator [Bacillota bacterium]MBQ4004824.1 RrF2 family transcriptional regulator [Bacillota bacterium]MBR3395118.1 RrF2 family transcriptional regulator [Bacillota bacterium]